MKRKWPNCHKIFDSSKKYCSVRCAREVQRQRRQILLGAMLGAVVFAAAIYTTPKTEFRPEPRLPIALAEIRQLAHDDSCPVCAGKTKVDCKVCIDGKIFYMGTSAECNRCRGKGWIICSMCKGTGKLQEALAAAKT